MGAVGWIRLPYYCVSGFSLVLLASTARCQSMPDVEGGGGGGGGDDVGENSWIGLSEWWRNAGNGGVNVTGTWKGIGTGRLVISPYYARHCTYSLGV